MGEGGVAQKESDVTESEFSRWKVAVENRMKADELRAEIDEKRSFKEQQIAAKKARQEVIQQKVKEQRIAARAKVDALRGGNLEKGASIKEYSVKHRQTALKQRTAYAEAGYELTRLHGPEQAKRTASRYVELARQKASFGQGGKEDRMALATQRIQQRTARLEEKRELVEKLKADEESAPAEAKKWAIQQKKASADVLRSEEKAVGLLPALPTLDPRTFHHYPRPPPRDASPHFLSASSPAHSLTCLTRFLDVTTPLASTSTPWPSSLLFPLHHHPTPHNLPFLPVMPSNRAAAHTT